MSDDSPNHDRRQVILRLEPETGTEPTEVEQYGRQLRVEMLATDIDSIDPVKSRPTPSGAKGVDPTTAEWLVTLSASGGVLTSLVATAKAWIERSGRNHRIAITLDGDTIEIERATSRERVALLEAFVHRHRVD